MIKVEKINKIERIGGGESHNFSIKVSRAAFSILSGLYSDTPKAIVRELSTNAMDSHVAAGKPLQPIQVHLPNSLEPYLIIKDEGLGLSHEDVIQIYSTYFESTKTQSNDFNGCLGLGSKAPFAYTDNFTITSIHTGIKRTYLAFFDEGGAPTLTLGSEQATDEENGVEIQIPVKPQDCNLFHSAAKEVYRWFSVLPNITGATIDFEDYKREISFSGKDWNIGKAKSDNSYASYNGNSVAVMGGVAYPIDMRKSDGQFYDLLRSGLAISFKIGDVDFVPSREALDYNERTIKALDNKLAEIKRDIVEISKGKMKEAKFMNEVMDIYNVLPRFVQSIIGDPIFNGKKVQAIRVPVRTAYYRGYTKNKAKISISESLSTSHFNKEFWSLDKPSNLWKIRYHIVDKQLSDIIIVDESVKNALINNYNFNPSIFNEVSSLTYTKQPKSGSGTSSISPYEVAGIFGDGGYYSKDAFENKPLKDLISNGATHYAVKEKGSNTHITVKGKSFAKKVIESSLPKPSLVVAVAPTKEKIATKAGMVSVEKLIEAELTSLSKNGDFCEFLSLYDAFQELNRPIEFDAFKTAAKEFNSNLSKTILLISRYYELYSQFNGSKEHNLYKTFNPLFNSIVVKKQITIPVLNTLEKFMINCIDARHEYGYRGLDYKNLTVQLYKEYENMLSK